MPSCFKEHRFYFLNMAQHRLTPSWSVSLNIVYAGVTIESLLLGRSAFYHGSLQVPVLQSQALSCYSHPSEHIRMLMNRIEGQSGVESVAEGLSDGARKRKRQRE